MKIKPKDIHKHIPDHIDSCDGCINAPRKLGKYICQICDDYENYNLTMDDLYEDC